MSRSKSPMEQSGSSNRTTPRRRRSTLSESSSRKDSMSSPEGGRLSTGALRRASGAGFNFDEQAIVQQNQIVCQKLTTPLRSRAYSEETKSSAGTVDNGKDLVTPATTQVSYDTTDTGGSVTPPLAVPVVPQALEATLEEQSAGVVAGASDEQVLDWNAENAFSLGRIIEGEQAIEVVRLDINAYFSVSQTVEALNAGRLACDGGMCIVWSASKSEYYLVLRTDKRADGIKLALEAFDVRVKTGDDADTDVEELPTAAAASTASANITQCPETAALACAEAASTRGDAEPLLKKTETADTPSAAAPAQEPLYPEQVKALPSAKVEAGQCQDVMANMAEARIGKRQRCKIFFRSVGDRVRGCFDGREA